MELQDWLADKFERRLENEGSRDDGQKETKLIAEFRNTLRTSLLVGLAKGRVMRRCFARLGSPTKPRPVAPERFTTTARLTMFVLVLQMVSRYSVTMTPTA
jgi:hypothetical protein